MPEIMNCLPESARRHFLRLKNEKSEAARSEHTRKLADLRGESAARGVLRSGHQELAEWQLAEEFIGKLAWSYFESAVETCTLYEIALDPRLAKCIEDGVRAFIVAQYRNAIQQTGTAGGHIKIPLHLRGSIASNAGDCRFPIFNSILIELEKARIESIKVAREKKAQHQTPRPSTPPTGSPMLRTATIIHVLIASPGDVTEERDVVSDCISAWNAAHSRTSGIMLHAVRWETHTIPASGAHPQTLINRQIVDEGDCLIGIFGVRLGTPTGEALSGTIEEIEIFRKAGKHVSLYFSTADVPRNADRDQLAALEAYQRERKKDTLYFQFANAEDLRRLVTQHLPGIVSAVMKQFGSLSESAGNSVSARVPDKDAPVETWAVKDVTLEAHYLGNHPSDSVVLVCEFVAKMPGKYIDDVSADEHVQRSEIESPALVARGVDSAVVEALQWQPTRMSFRDEAGQLHEFSGSLRYISEANALRFIIHD